jgi:hypothetical protein
MGWFGERSAKQPRRSEAAMAAVGNRSGPTAILQALDQAVPQYIGKADRGDLIYPACKRTPTDADGNVRAIWEHTRIEAMRYVVMVPGREVELLVDPVRQPEMLEAFLRRPPHEDTVVDFTGVAIDDFVIATLAGLNWLNHCAVLAGVDRDKFSGTLRNFRKIVVIAQQWWALEGSGPRCAEMLLRHEKPPLMLYLIWLEYTRLAKEIAIAATRRSSEPNAAPEALAETMARLESARDPDDLAGA